MYIFHEVKSNRIYIRVKAKPHNDNNSNRATSPLHLVTASVRKKKKRDHTIPLSMFVCSFVLPVYLSDLI